MVDEYILLNKAVSVTRGEIVRKLGRNIKEAELRQYFSRNAEKLGYKIVNSQEAFPDLTLKKIGTNEIVKAELEVRSRDFYNHVHNPKGCDMIICWDNNWSELPNHLEVLSLKRYFLNELENPEDDFWETHLKYINEQRRWFEASLTCSACHNLQKNKPDSIKSTIIPIYQKSLISLLTIDIERSTDPIEYGDEYGAKLLQICIKGDCEKAIQYRRELAKSFFYKSQKDIEHSILNSQRKYQEADKNIKKYLIEPKKRYYPKRKELEDWLKNL